MLKNRSHRRPPIKRSSSPPSAATLVLEDHDEEKEDDPTVTMTWREDYGISQFVPMHPKNAADPSLLPQYSMAQVAQRNTLQTGWIVMDERVYDITNFIAKHPGGENVLINMLGKDCTDAFANYHSAAVYRKWLPQYLIGAVHDVPVYPHVQDFRDLRQTLLKMGLFRTNQFYYYQLYAWLATLFGTSLYLTLQCPSPAAHMLGGAIMGLFWQQMAGWGHDIGHSSVSHDCQWDNFIGSTIGCAFMGISVGWWKRSHNTHHVVCNSIEHDPDIQHMPLMAVTPAIMKTPFWSSYHHKVVSVDAAARFCIRHQHWFFIPIMLVARINLYIQSLLLILTTMNRKDAIIMYNRGYEMMALTIYFGWVLAVAWSLPTVLERVGWLAVSHAVSGLLHVQICLSHFSMDTYHGNAYNDASDEWYLMQIKTTMNVDCYEWMDWFHIGLQYQIEHHLFPTLPRHNLRIAKRLVQQVCLKHDIDYHEQSFWDGVVKTILGLRETAMRARQGDFDYESSTVQIRDLLNANG